jgi:esterase/lipase superfamily enzyme
MRTEAVLLSDTPTGDRPVLVYGHYGRPVLVLASDAGHAHDFEANGMVDAVADLIDGGAVKLYCIDSFESGSWRRGDLPVEERAREHLRHEGFVVDHVVPFIYRDCGGVLDIALTGCSFGAYHAANFSLRRADLFPRAICLSGSYDLSPIGWGERGDTFYFNNPMDYVAHLHGDHLEWLRSRVFLTLVAGQGPWEDESASGALPSTRRLAGLLAEKEIPHNLDIWGHDSAHDWPWWRRQLAYHLPSVV